MATREQLIEDFADHKYATGEKFARLINSMKLVQEPVESPAESGTSNSFIDSISQGADGKITATKKSVVLNYARIQDKPTINGVTLMGDKTPAQLGLATANQVEVVSNKVDKLPSGYYYGKFNSVEDLPEATEKGYAYVASSDPTVFYTYLVSGAGAEWVDSGNKMVNTVDITTPKTAETELSKEEKYYASANVSDRPADVVIETGVVRSLGYRVLSPNLSFAEQVNSANTIYEIKDEFDLGGNVTIPAGCTLKFNGGRLAGEGALNFNGALLEGDVKIMVEPAWNEQNEFDEAYKPKNLEIKTSWFGATADGVSDDAPALQRAIKCLHKNGSKLVFDKTGTYLMGDGISDDVNDTNKTLHTGYSYPSLHPCLSGSNLSNFATNYPGYTLSQYLQEYPADLGRDIALIFFRFNNLVIDGSNSTLLSNPNNGYCYHNRLLVFTGCKDCCIKNLIVDANRGERGFTQQGIYLSDYNVGNVGHKNPENYDSYYDMLNESSTWNGVTGTYSSLSGWRNVDSIECLWSEGCVFENITSTNGLMDGIMITANCKAIVVNNSMLSYSGRHGITLGSVDDCVIKNSSFYGSGYVIVNNEEVSAYFGGSSQIDMENESNAVTGTRSKNNIIESCTFYNAAYATIVVARQFHKTRISHCLLKSGYINLVSGTNCLDTEVSYCTVLNGTIGLSQEGSHIHHNTVTKIVGNSLATLVDKRKSYIEGYITGTTSNAASIISTLVEYNNFSLEFDNPPKSSTEMKYKFVLEDNIIFRHNVFNNYYYIDGYSGYFYLAVREFTDNTFLYDTTKYPNISQLTKIINQFTPYDLTTDSLGIRYSSFVNTKTTPVFTEVVKSYMYSSSNQYVELNNLGFYTELDVVTNGPSASKPAWFRRFKIIRTASGTSCAAQTSVVYEDIIINTISTANCKCYYEQQTTGKVYLDFSGLTVSGGYIYLKLRLYKNTLKLPSSAYFTFSSTAPTISTPYEAGCLTGSLTDLLPDQTNRFLYSKYDANTKNYVNNDYGTIRDVYGFPNVSHRGTSTQRPNVLTSDDYGFEYFDTTLGKPIYWNGYSWIDGNGDYIFDNSGTLQNRLALTSPIKGQQFKLTREGETDVYLIYDYGWLNATDRSPWFDDSGTLNAMYDKYNYTLLTEEPSDWPTKYNTYYKIVDSIYTKLTELETWATDTYYKLDVNAYKGIQVKLTDTDTELLDKVVKWNGTKYINVVDNVALKAGTPTVIFTTENNITTATITSTSSGKLYYTKNGNDPTSSSTEYSSAITLADGDQVKAICVRDHMDNSAVGFVKVATPVITFNSDGILTITCETPNAKIYYTIDGSTPTTSSTEYDSSASVTIAKGVTVNAIAVLIGRVNSKKGFEKRS